MVNIRSEIWYFIALFIISVILVLDLFIHTGRPATMDGLTHITTIAQFAQALKSGDFPVVWLNNFANYGLPIGIIAHQLPSYSGAVLTLITNDPLLAFNVLTFLGVVGSCIVFYFFLRIYFSPLYAFLGTFLFNFAPYRIINIYIRGAIPETVSAIFLPLILIALYIWIKKKRVNGFFLLIASLLLLILTHPMMFVIYSFVFIPYFLFLVLIPFSSIKKKPVLHVLRKSILFGSAVVVSLGLAAYYLIPLLYEVKYLYYGQESNHFAPNQFLMVRNFIDPSWYYFYNSDIFTRGHFIKSGLLEMLGVVVGVLAVFIIQVKRKSDESSPLFTFTVALSIILLFFTTKFSDIFYQSIHLLGNVQFPWRMLSAFIFLPPIIIIFLLSRLQKTVLVVVLIVLVAIIRFPQLYGKNYAVFPESTYYFNTKNLHSTSMNTIWTGETEDYPVKNKKGEIVSGEGVIEKATIHNSQRAYQVSAATPITMADYTFYFPGWNVYVDGQPTEIQFQDPNYRGVITYTVPAGHHIIEMKLEDTKVRLLSKVISIIAFLFLGGILLFRRKLNKFIVSI